MRGLEYTSRDWERLFMLNHGFNRCIYTSLGSRSISVHILRHHGINIRLREKNSNRLNQVKARARKITFSFFSPPTS